MGEDEVCAEYFEKGFCLKGMECTKMHTKIEEESKEGQEKSTLLRVLFAELP